MDKYLKKLKEINNDKAKDVIKLIEAITPDTPENQRKETIEVAKDLIEAELTSNDIRELLRNALKDKFQQEFGPFILDFSDTFVIFELESDQAWKADFSISNNKVVFGDAIKVIPKTTFEPIMEAKKDKNGQFDMFEKSKAETITGDYIKLIESGISDNGTVPIKIISPGWGSSGYYPEEVLERDASIYKEGTKMYWNHPTATEDIERPERSLNDLAAIIVSGGVYNSDGASGAGVYAEAKVFSDYVDKVSEMAGDIGLSHIASGMATMGDIDGRSGRIIESLKVADSVDFVTKPGAGGEVIQLFESATNSKLLKPIKMAENKEELTKLEESNKTLLDDNQRMKEKIALQDAREFVADKLKESELPEITKQRLLERESKNIVLDDKGSLDLIKFGESVKASIEEETKYLARLSESGKIKGMGPAGNEGDAEEAKLNESNKSYFEELGLSEVGVKVAINGR